MKDVISILQSRIAKRENEIAIFESGYYDGRLTLVDGEYVEARPFIRILAKQQKEDKRILAEIVKLRRVAKTRKRSNPYMLSQLLEGHETEEMQTAIMAAHFGER
jgi:hypothetical protein